MPSTVYWIGGSGSQSWTNTANWSGGAVPATGDTVYVRNAASSIDQGLGQSSVLLANLFVERTFTGRIGATNGTALAIGFTYARVGDSGGSASSAGGTTTLAGGGSGAIVLDSGTNPATLEVISTKSSGDDSGLEQVRWIGAHTANALVVLDGTVGVATTTPTQTASLGSLAVSGGAVNLGAGVTWFGATNQGQLLIQSGNGTNTALVNLGGKCTCRGNVYLHQVTLLGGTFAFGNRAAGGGGSIGTLNMQGGAVDATADGRAFTVSTTNFREGTITQLYAGQGTYTSVTLDFSAKDSPAVKVA